MRFYNCCEISHKTCDVHFEVFLTSLSGSHSAGVRSGRRWEGPQLPFSNQRTPSEEKLKVLSRISPPNKQLKRDRSQVSSLRYGALSSTKVKGSQNYFLKDIHNFVLCNAVQLNGVLKSSAPKSYLERNGYHGPPPRWDWEHRWCSSAQWHSDHALWSNQAKMRSLLVVLPKNEKVGIAWLKKKSEIKNCPASKIRNGLPEQVLDMFQEALRRWTR